MRLAYPDSGRGGYDAAWRRLALEAIEAQPWCTDCGGTVDLQGDHINPRKRTNLTLADVAVRCGPCNRKKSGRVLDVYRGR